MFFKVGEFLRCTANRRKGLNAVEENRGGATDGDVDRAVPDIATDAGFVETAALRGVIDVFTNEAFNKEHVRIL